MNKVYLSGPILALSLFATIANGEPADQLPATKKEPTMLDRWNEVRRQAAIATGAITTYPPPTCKKICKAGNYYKWFKYIF